MVSKLLIANRGEIACRTIATAERLGIRTVAVFSDADAGAKHVAMADEAVRLGPAPAAESYLRGDLILAAAAASGAEAIHPGYGFLSEAPDFADAVAAAGLTFVGPPASAIRAMGLKDAAKALMEEAGVPVVPGYHGAVQEVDLLGREADRIGYPILIKARAGGGGKGMRRVDAPGDFAEALAAAQREAAASFGDPACLIEKFVSQPRHIEIQIFADAHGNVVHLFERDCSLQRRHQKVIEEAPAPNMPEPVRAAMGRAAVEAARAIGYRGAGTVEFIADGTGPLREDGFWFMEMNTRLQVEHPVSEAITGLDFVELQLRLAMGAPLPFRQGDLRIDGWAIEARLYAEDARKGFLPATGRLDHLIFPDCTAFEPGSVRVDSGVRAGDEVTPWYDPMIAKVIAHGATRAEARARLDGALATCEVAGTVTNRDFLGALVRHPGFASGDVDTGLIDRNLAMLTESPPPAPPLVALAAVAGLGLLAPPTEGTPWDTLTGWRLWSEPASHIDLVWEGSALPCRVTPLGDGRFRIGDGTSAAASAGSERPPPCEITAAQVGDSSVSLSHGGHVQRVGCHIGAGRITLFAEGRTVRFDIIDPLDDDASHEAEGDAIRAPMPGRVTEVTAVPGAAVAKGDALIVLEAMKMEHRLTAPRDGAVADVCIAPGDQVQDGALLLTLEPEDG